MSNIIFDFDGTIADTFNLIVDVSYGVTGAKRLPQQEIDKLRDLPLLMAIRRLGGKFWHIPKLMVLVRPRMRSRMAEAKPFNGIVDVIVDLHEAGHKLFILSSNKASNVEVFLQTQHLVLYFENVYGVIYGNAWLKARALKKILRSHSFAASDCYYIGNEVLDIHAAQKVGMKSVAVTWSGHNEAHLKAAKPDFVATKPSDISRDLLQ